MAASILRKIFAKRRDSVAVAEASCPQRELQAQAADCAPARDLTTALRRVPFSVLAEVKKASPSRGVLRAEFDPVALARDYAAGGAAAVSVVTEPEFFSGSLDWLTAIRRHVELPLLRKDFTFSTYQIWEARVHGADAILLILAMLEDVDVRTLMDATHEAGMQALVEIHNETEAERALALDAGLIGVNNRDLETFEVTLETSRRLARLLPEAATKVAESGIFTRADCLDLAGHGYHSFLIGEALVTASQPGRQLSALLKDDGPG